MYNILEFIYLNIMVLRLVMMTFLFTNFRTHIWQIFYYITIKPMNVHKMLCIHKMYIVLSGVYTIEYTRYNREEL